MSRKHKELQKIAEKMKQLQAWITIDILKLGKY